MILSKDKKVNLGSSLRAREAIENFVCCWHGFESRLSCGVKSGPHKRVRSEGTW